MTYGTFLEPCNNAPITDEGLGGGDAQVYSGVLYIRIMVQPGCKQCLGMVSTAKFRKI
ncbi:MULTISPECIES: hypothetical protein [unclassified Rickettsia]|uniref:hypothetical protein n=1 Tax=unclassified Rickettsia TaxID=114295 RepID=UPI003132A22E